MLSFQNLYQEAQLAAGGDTSTDTTTVLKRAINQAIHKFRAAMNREWVTTRRTFSPVASQQFYQLPEDAIRLKSVTITVGDVSYPLREVVSEDQWRRLNAVIQTADIPECFYIRGTDEFGIWPIPSASLASGGEMVYESRLRDLSADDYTAGTITATQDSATIVGSSTVFTAAMVGRSLKINDSSPDGIWYKIASYTDATHVSLENVYEGTTGAGKNYIIGELPEIPEEFHLALVDFAMYRYFLRRRNSTLAEEYRGSFQDALQTAKRAYSMKSSAQVIDATPVPNQSFWKQDIKIDT